MPPPQTAKYKRVAIPPQHQNNSSHLLLLTHEELRTIARALIYMDEPGPLFDWALETHFKEPKSNT